VILGGKELIPEAKNDIIFANINRNILLDQLNENSRSVEKNGLLLISGILKEDVETLINKAKMEGFSFESEKILDNWVMLAFRRN
jgi:ribosomal protein L11 methyltransferase